MRTVGLALLLSLTTVAAPAEARKAAAGKPAFKAGDPEAIWIWHDAAGWHLRTTTARRTHAFRGVVRGQGFSEVKATRKTLDAKVIVLGDASIRFDFDSFEGIDGFDWKAAGPCTTWELRIDGRPMAERVHVGATGESPSVMPFDACE
ncbi:MAG: hypothetical protein EXR72_18820 [Myxococcales bacterium]|nr:hypothetical protein [Myxococcales bacterium]